uniref:Ig-like domain-containing protein n=1 Tax=Sinocyclocheilus grahami TaxID=75366 RepID=A0A672PJM5_SINGR
MEVCLLVILIISGVFTDSIKPNDKDTNMIKREGEPVTLSCTYDTSSNYVYLYWYRQYPNREPQYLLRKGARSYSGNEDIPDPRFQSTTSQTSTELTITGVTLSDSALYYCALRVAAQ